MILMNEQHLIQFAAVQRMDEGESNKHSGVNNRLIFFLLTILKWYFMLNRKMWEMERKLKFWENHKNFTSFPGSLPR